MLILFIGFLQKENSFPASSSGQASYTEWDFAPSNTMVVLPFASPGVGDVGGRSELWGNFLSRNLIYQFTGGATGF